tara:strand:- start:219 stop:590 length:372 start_codon:yes stop_codon:yes gene_type:complete
MNIEEVWKQAESFSKCINLSNVNEKAYMYKGIKIIKRDGKIKIFSTQNSQMQYHEMNPEEYKFFGDLGFVDAVHIVVKKTYKRKIDLINDKIKAEVNTRNNKKHYDSLKLKRETLINKYSNLN